MSNALPVSGSVQQQLEAVTAERDFFREKYAAQMNEMESMQSELKESRRMIDKLRSQILELEVERARMAGECGDCFSPVKVVSAGDKTKTPKKNEGGSANTSITSIATSVDSTRSSPDGMENEGSGKYNSPKTECCADAVVSDITISDSTDDILRCDDDDVEETGMKSLVAEEGDISEDGNSTDDETNDGDESADEEDGADQIRAKAERMLIWANYQTHRRSTPMKDSSNGYDTDNFDGDSVTHSEVTSPTSTPKCSIRNIPPNLTSSKSLLDDSSSLGSAS